MKTFLLLVTFCNSYHDTCDYEVFEHDLSYQDCITLQRSQQAVAPLYMWECVEEDKE